MIKRNKLATALLTIGAVVGSYAQNNVEALVASETGKSKARINLFQELPLGIKDYSFIELNKDSYFLRNIMTKKVAKNLEVRVDTKHGNNFLDHGGIGVQYKVPVEELTLKVNVSPFWFDKNGKKEDFAMVGYFLNKKWKQISGKNLDLNVSSFGEFNAAKGQWSYGETNLYASKKGSKLEAGIGVNCYNKGEAMPKIVPRLALKYNF